ncbi:MAG: DUF2202 domain-containing protein [Sulfurovum sp.]|nr:DUF2202 domain-containing protein [Sulfurovum sp.]
MSTYQMSTPRRKLIKFSLATGAYLFTGCSSNKPNEDNTNASAMDDFKTEANNRIVSSREVLVERSTLMTNCIVIDSVGRTAIERDGGIYRFKKQPMFPIYVFSGVVNFASNGHITQGDAKNNLMLEVSPSRIGTIVTTIASDENKRTWLKENFSLSDKEIDTEIPRSNKTIAAISDEVLKYCTQNNISKPSQIDVTKISKLTSDILIRIEKYKTSTKESIELEKELVTQLKAPLANKEDVTYYQYGSTNPKIVIDQLPKYELNDEQKYALAFMWNEERLAGDAYGAFHTALYQNLSDKEKEMADRILNTIHHAERLHEEAVEALIKKYDIDILDLDDYDGAYSKEELENMKPGVYPIKKLQEIWDNVAPVGTKSLKDAFRIGAITEIGDIEDLDRYIQIADKAIDFRYVMEFLRDGSILHYWVFDKALKELGIKEGACSISSRYCKQKNDFEINGDGGTRRPLLRWVQG